jgi:hypothetical protein
MDVEKPQSLNVLDMLQRVIVRQDHIMVGKNAFSGFTPNQGILENIKLRESVGRRLVTIKLQFIFIQKFRT